MMAAVESSTRKSQDRTRSHNAEIRKEVSFPDLLARYGVTIDSKGLGRCPFPGNHRNGDAKPSLQYDASANRVYCNSSRCFDVGKTKGVDLFGFVQLMERCDFQGAVKILADVLCERPYQSKPRPSPVRKPNLQSSTLGTGSRGTVTSYKYHNRAGDLVYTIIREDREQGKDFKIKRKHFVHLPM